MRTGPILALCLASAGLGGCGVISQEPLFPLDQASKHPLRDGLWAITNPGCDVKPMPAGQPLPECVGYTMTIAGSRLELVLTALPFGMQTPAQLRAMNGQTRAPGDFVLVDGDPAIIEIIGHKPASATPQPSAPAPVPGAQAQAEPHVSYMSMRPLDEDVQGRVVRGVIWSIPCPDKPDSAPGFKKPEGAGLNAAGLCLAETSDAVRTQAPHMKPFMSFFVTWIR